MLRKAPPDPAEVPTNAVQTGENMHPMSSKTPVSTTTSQTADEADDYEGIIMKSFLHSTCGQEVDSKCAQLQVLEILKEHFGFVTPIPLPESSNLLTKVNEHKMLAAVLGLPSLKHTNLFFQMLIGRICTKFTHCFISRGKPDDELWDIGQDNWKTLTHSQRLSSVRQVKNDSCEMFMFDLGTSASVPWNLAVYTASAVLFVCRLDEDFGEEEIAMELVSSGVPFRTLQRKDTLARAPKDRESNLMIPL